ncbi:contactin [Drosophila eugracilis]|uniref:contactin n=1 Tax=Drosophila eugracilis TaxID=29029 RepID=UPI0007E67D7F|nr:contactin [Drosophila eugracilis]XP_017081686.1 contactin [Drosophila eugracilis]XP_017081687.1 contactin [Drosophila eugracilis]
MFPKRCLQVALFAFYLIGLVTPQSPGDTPLGKTDPAQSGQQPTNYQPSYNKDYLPRYNPLYTGQQQSSDQSQFDNPLHDGQSPSTYKGYYDGRAGAGALGGNVVGPGNNLGGVGPQYDPFNRNSIGSVGVSYRDEYSNEDNFCPEHWVSFRQTCYRFIRSPKRNWAEAKKICKAYNADLINVENVEKHSFILKNLILQNQRQNRFFISARQTGPLNWVNDDNTQLVQIEDSFSLDEQVPLENEDLHDNRFLVQNDLNNRNINNPNQFYNSLPGTINQRNQNNLRGFLGPNQLYGDNGYVRDRVVYAFSKKRDRWMFMPAYEIELNLFICESKVLYNPDNVNIKLDDKRPYHYGLDITDMERIPRGPFFVKQPNDTTFDVNKNRLINDVTLSCLAGGFPTPSYQWYREAYVDDTLEYHKIDPLQQDRYTISGGNLIIYEPKQALDQGAYHCVAENKFGRIRSESAHLNFGFIMEFNLKRSAETSEMNWGKSIFCDPPQHYPDVRYYWARDYFPNFVEEDQRVFVSRDGALYFSFIETVDRANYSCTVQTLVSDTGRNGPFFPLRVTPNSNYQALIFANTFPKVFPEAPVAGDEIRLECMAFGYPIPSYNWTRQGLPLQRNAYTINYGRVLIIQNATTNDNGEYSCTITNPRKTLLKSIYINIQMRPQFTIPLKDMIKDYNSDVTFICEAFAIPDANYTWYKNAERLDPKTVNRDRYIIQDNVLTIKFLEKDKDEAMYQCGAQNQLKTSFSSAQLRVLSMKPSFKKHPLESEVYAVYNGNTTIVCNPEAAPRPKFQWKKDGQVIGSGGHRRILPSGTLTIAPTSRDDEGVYTCIASNQAGTDESHARVIVLQEIRFIETPPQRIVSREHDLIFLHCEAAFDELLDIAYVWKHNGETLKNNHDGTGRIVVDWNRLTVHNTTMRDAGDYECVVKSAVNEISSKTSVSIEGAPGAPGGVQVIQISKTKAIIEWVDGASNGRAIRYYNILGRTNWNRTWVNVSTHVQAREVDRYTSRQQAEVVNLTPWSAYEFSVTAVNDLGIGTPSAPSPIYSTYEDKPYIAPRNVGGGGGKIGDLTITWDPLLPQEQHSHGIYYKVFWKLKGAIEWASGEIKKQDHMGVAVVNIPLNNYYTEYEVKVQAINSIGKGPESGIAVIHSAEDMPQVAPQKPIAIAFNSTCFNVTWQPIDMSRENIRGKLIGHRLKYWKTTHQEEDSVYYLSRTTRNWALIVGLQPDTYYFVKVMAYNAAGEGPESERFEERTYRKAPQKPPSSVHVYGINPSTVRVVWRYVSPSQDEEPVEGYKVRIWETDQNMITANNTIVPIGQKLESYINTLTPGKSYNMRVLAYSNGGDGRMSSPTLRFQMGKTTRNAASSQYGHNVKLAFISSTLIAIVFYSSY